MIQANDTVGVLSDSLAYALDSLRIAREALEAAGTAPPDFGVMWTFAGFLVSALGVLAALAAVAAAGIIRAEHEKAKRAQRDAIQEFIAETEKLRSEKQSELDRLIKELTDLKGAHSPIVADPGSTAKASSAAPGQRVSDLADALKSTYQSDRPFGLVDLLIGPELDRAIVLDRRAINASWDPIESIIEFTSESHPSASAEVDTLTRRLKDMDRRGLRSFSDQQLLDLYILARSKAK